MSRDTHIKFLQRRPDGQPLKKGVMIFLESCLMTKTSIGLFIVVGGVHVGEMKKPLVIDRIGKTSKHAKRVASVCTGAFPLAESGVISSHKVTTHREDIPDPRQRYPNLEGLDNRRWVDEGDIVTSGGIAAGIDMSLHLVGKTHGIERAGKTARQMEFEWTKNK